MEHLPAIASCIAARAVLIAQAGLKASVPVGKNSMAFKPNYNQQRAERTRAKQAKQDAKRREKEEAVARRKAAQDAGELPADAAAEPAGDHAGG
jgi:hypothetical protein